VLGKKNFKNDFGLILHGTSFQAFDIHSTITDIDALFILPLGVSIGTVFIQSGIIVFTNKMLEWFVNCHIKWL
jgi:hypothetical protein